MYVQEAANVPVVGNSVQEVDQAVPVCTLRLNLSDSPPVLLEVSVQVPVKVMLLIVEEIDDIEGFFN